MGTAGLANISFYEFSLRASTAVSVVARTGRHLHQGISMVFRVFQMIKLSLCGWWFQAILIQILFWILSLIFYSCTCLIIWTSSDIYIHMVCKYRRVSDAFICDVLSAQDEWMAGAYHELFTTVKSHYSGWEIPFRSVLSQECVKEWRISQALPCRLF